MATTVVVKSVFGRNKPLFALPLYSVGKLDIHDQIENEGAFVDAMLPVMYFMADIYGIDVAFCTTSRSAYYVMQVRRLSSCHFKSGPFWMLSPKLRAESDRLAV